MGGRQGRWLAWVPGCAAQGMAVPLADKELRPLRGAFGVLDREPLARHRQMEGQARSLPQPTPRSPLRCVILGPIWDHTPCTRENKPQVTETLGVL